MCPRAYTHSRVCPVKITMHTALVALSVLLAGCMHSKRTYIQVVGGLSKQPLEAAKVTASLYDPVNPDLKRTRISEVFTGSNGIAVIKIPMCGTRGPLPKYFGDLER